MDCFVASLLAMTVAAHATKTVVARLDRAIQYAATSRFITDVSGILDHPPARMVGFAALYPPYESGAYFSTLSCNRAIATPSRAS